MCGGFPIWPYDNGGGAFLVAWMIGLLVLGIPWLIMEFGMGKMFQKGAPGSICRDWQEMGMGWMVAGMGRLPYCRLLCSCNRMGV